MVQHTLRPGSSLCVTKCQHHACVHWECGAPTLQLPVLVLLCTPRREEPQVTIQAAHRQHWLVLEGKGAGQHTGSGCFAPAVLASSIRHSLSASTSCCKPGTCLSACLRKQHVRDAQQQTRSRPDDTLRNSFAFCNRRSTVAAAAVICKLENNQLLHVPSPEGSMLSSRHVSVPP